MRTAEHRKALTSPRTPPLQPVSLLVAAEMVDEGAELLHVTDMLSCDHLLLDYVCLRQVCPFLKRHSFHQNKAQVVP